MGKHLRTNPSKFIFSGVTRDLSQGEILAEKCLLATVAKGPHQPTLRKKTWETMVHPDVDGHTTTINHRKIHRKTQKQPTENQKNTKTEA